MLLIAATDLLCAEDTISYAHFFVANLDIRWHNEERSIAAVAVTRQPVGLVINRPRHQRRLPGKEASEEGGASEEVSDNGQ